jgi:hypothetical protein
MGVVQRMGPRTRRGEQGDLRPMDATPGITISQRRVEELHERLNGLLDALDHAQLHGPAAYVSMAVDTIQRDYPDLSATR